MEITLLSLVIKFTKEIETGLTAAKRIAVYLSWYGHFGIYPHCTMQEMFPDL